MTAVKEFYNQIQFPGLYSVDSLDYHDSIILNPYLILIDKFLSQDITVLDVGCGSGFISNFFAKKYNQSRFTGVDFSPSSIRHAQLIAKESGINNVEFIECDFASYSDYPTYNVVICQGVLHHMPSYNTMIKKLSSLVQDNGILILGVYHPWGKIAKRYFSIDYQDTTLHLDQENHPYETSFDFETVKDMLPDFEMLNHYPNWLGLVALPNLFNYKNGGLTTYVFKKN